MVDVWDALTAALRLDPALFARISEDPWPMLWPAIGVAVIASISTMLGHVAVFLLNHIGGWRLATSLALSTIWLASLHIIQVAVTWAVASLVLQRPQPLLALIVVGLLSTAPLSFSFVTAMPHFGLMIGRLLQVWSYLVIVVGVSATFRLGIVWSIGLTVVGWVVMQTLSRLLQRPLGWVSSRVWTLATGRPTMVTSRDILAGTPIIPISHPVKVGP